MEKRENHDKINVHVAHSPDADDRFMFWPLRAGKIDPGPFAFTWEEADTQSLNALATQGGPEVCAISVFHYANVWSKYQPLRMGCSVGNDYGPVIVARKGCFPNLQPLEKTGREAPQRFVQPNSPSNPGEEAAQPTVLLTPGPQTTAHNVTHLLGFASLPWEAVPIVPIERVFHRLEEHEAHGQPALALLIHEGRLIFEQFGCERVLDIGKAWKARTGGSLPLGMNVVRRDLPMRMRETLSELFIESCTWAQAHREEFLDEAGRTDSPFHTKLTRAQLSAYLDLYANETTREVLPEDARAFERLFEEAGRAGLYGQSGPIPCDWV